MRSFTFSRIVLLALFSCSAMVAYEVEGESPPWHYLDSSWKIRVGDNSSWSAVDLYESDWENPKPGNSFFNKGNDHSDIPKGIFWIRAKIVVNDSNLANQINTLYHRIRGAREIYWDGYLLGGSGVPGTNKNEETPGLRQHWLQVPNHLLEPGIHQIAIRTSSNYHMAPAEELVAELYLWNNNEHFPHLTSLIAFDSATYGFTLVAFLVFLTIYLFAERKMSYLIFSGLCGSIALGNYASIYASSAIDQATYQDEAIVVWTMLTCLVSACILAQVFVLYYFSIPRRRLLTTTAGITTILTFFVADRLEDKVNAMIIVSGTAACCFTLWASWKRKPGSWFILVGIGVVLVTQIYDRNDVLEDYAFLVLMVSVLVPLTTRIGKDKELRQKELLDKANLESSKARLENELIKRSIQPHFLMNTLNALIDWIEEDPKTGVVFIHELSRHFQILLKVSGQDKIKLSTEIELCQALLSIMSYRKEKHYRLEVEGFVPEAMIPPFALHTLVENGITHNRSKSSSIEFNLKCEYKNTESVYILKTPFCMSDSRGSLNARQKGTGLKYVESRLEESYPGNWSIVSNPSETYWITRIEIRSENGATVSE